MNKKRIFAFLLAFTLLFSQFAFAYTPREDEEIRQFFLQQEKAEKEKRKLPAVNYIRSRKIDVKNISINLKFDWEKEQAFGTSAVTLSPFNDTNKINLDAAMMTINSVKLLSGKDLKFNYAGGDTNDNLEILLDRDYKAGENVTVIVDYKTNYVNTADGDTAIGSFGRGLRFIKPTADQPNKPRQIWSQGETEFNRYWFPSYDSPNDFRTTEVKATVEKKYSVVSNGKLVSDTPAPNGMHTVYWKMDIPYSNYLTSIVVGEYKNVIQNANGTPVYNFGYPSEFKEVAETVKRLPDTINFFSKMTGVKYSYPKYSQTFVEDFGGGMENISATTQIEEMIHDSREMLDEDSDSLQSHELAHQWFGDYVTCRDWGQIWLNESFATYFQALYNEYSKGHENFLYDNVYQNQQQYYQTWNRGNRRPIVTKYYANKDAMFDTYAYPRGGAVLHMLRKHLGDANWWKAINHYLVSNAHQPVSTEDFRIAIEEATGESMDWFFDQWLYKMGHPIFEVTKNYSNGKLTLNVKQTQKIDPNNEFPQVEFFQGKMDIEIDGKINQIWIEPKAEQTFTFDTVTEPKLVNFDYEGTWIKELRFDKPLEELAYQLKNDKDVLGRKWALQELSMPRPASSNKKPIVDLNSVFADVIKNDSSWQMRGDAVDSLMAFQPSDSSFLATTENALLSAVKDKNSNVRAKAIKMLGSSGNPKYADLYRLALNDQSYSVMENAAVSLGNLKDSKDYDVFMKLVNTESWHGHYRIAGLRGLSGLGDKRAFDTAYKYATDKTQRKGVRSAALIVVAETGKGDSRAYPLVKEGFDNALKNQDFQGLFDGVQAIIKLADPRGQEVFDTLKEKFGKNPQFMGYITMFENRFKEALKK